MGVGQLERMSAEQRHRRLCEALTSTQGDSLGCSGGRVVHNPYCEAESVRVRALSVEESTRSSVKSVMGEARN